MILGIYGDIVFAVSPSFVRTFDNLKRKLSVRHAKHDIIAKSPKIEFQGMDLAEVSFDMRLDRNLGVNPEDEIKAIERMATDGWVAGLTIGDRYYGKFMITDIDEQVARTYRDGSVMVAELGISLVEYIDD